MFVRTRFQYGSLRLRKRERGSDVWEFRYYETNPEGKRIRQSVILGDQALYRTEDDARKATQALLMRLNDEAPREEMVSPTFGALLDRYIEHELLERHSTRSSHLSNIRKHIRPRWGDQPVSKLKPMAMEQWLRDLPLAPKSKVHIRSLMHLVLKCAERWGVIEIGKNPVTLVRVKNASKRLKRPQILEVGQFFAMLKHLAEPYRTMVMVAQCTGLRMELSTQRGETIVPSGATSANALGLTTQVPTRTIYLTSGRSRKLMLRKQVVQLQHVPSWQLALAKEPAGEIVRALAWAGPERVHEVLKEIEGKVPRSELQKINQHISLFPGWMASALSQSATYA